MNQDLFRQLAIKSFDNAKELYDEAKLLYDNNHYSRCVFLSQIGGEELGKHFICSSDYINSLLGRLNEKKFKNRFYNHRKKSTAISNAEDFFIDILNNRVEDGLFLKGKTNIEILEQAKLRSLYTDFFEDDVSAKPSEIYDKKLAEEALKWLLNRIKLFEKIGVISMLRENRLDSIENITNLKKIDKKFKSLFRKDSNSHNPNYRI